MQKHTKEILFLMTFKEKGSSADYIYPIFTEMGISKSQPSLISNMHLWKIWQWNKTSSIILYCTFCTAELKHRACILENIHPRHLKICIPLLMLSPSLKHWYHCDKVWQWFDCFRIYNFTLRELRRQINPIFTKEREICPYCSQVPVLQSVIIN